MNTWIAIVAFTRWMRLEAILIVIYGRSWSKKKEKKRTNQQHSWDYKMFFFFNPFWFCNRSYSIRADNQKPNGMKWLLIWGGKRSYGMILLRMQKSHSFEQQILLKKWVQIKISRTNYHNLYDSLWLWTTISQWRRYQDICSRIKLFASN